jgi:hypothetical protein
MFQELQQAIGTGLVISNNRIIDGVKGTMMEGWGASSGGIQQLQDAAVNGLLVQAHHYNSNCTEVLETQLAAFLIGAGQYVTLHPSIPTQPATRTHYPPLMWQYS